MQKWLVGAMDLDALKFAIRQCMKSVVIVDASSIVSIKESWNYCEFLSPTCLLAPYEMSSAFKRQNSL